MFFMENYNKYKDNIIIQNLLSDDSTFFENELFAYIPMRLSGLGIVEREKEGKVTLYDRDKEDFTQDSFMKMYANLPICVLHPEHNGNKVALGFDYKDSIIGNTIHSYVKNNEIWVIAKIYDKEALHAIKNNNFSTSPHFVTQTTEKTLENGDIVLKETPIYINHLAIVASGFWDKKSKNNSISNKEQDMSETQNDKNTEPKVDENNTSTQADDTNTQTQSDSTQTGEATSAKVDDTDSNPKTESQADSDTNTQASEDTNTSTKVDDEPPTNNTDLQHVITALSEQIKIINDKIEKLEKADNTLSDSELEEKDEVIEAINDIADSSEFINKVRIRDNEKAHHILQNFLKSNKKNISEKYHNFIDSIQPNAVNVAKEVVLQDLQKNIMNLQKQQKQESGWVQTSSLPNFRF